MNRTKIDRVRNSLRLFLCFLTEITAQPAFTTEETAILVMKTLKAHFPLSDKFLTAFVHAVELGVDFTALTSEKDIVSLESHDVVKKQLFCNGCFAAIENGCADEEYVLSWIAIKH